jgi:hypothetical protein
MKIDSLTLKYARKYARRAWFVVPIPAKEKAPRLKGWRLQQRTSPRSSGDEVPGGGLPTFPASLLGIAGHRLSLAR